MYRRVFLTTLAGGLLAAPLAAEAQQTEKVYRVGILTTYPVTHGFDDFVAALRDLGYVEGQNLALEIRSANNIPERVPALAVELVRLNVAVIVTGGDGEVAAAQQATRTIPIVMAPSGDPVHAGYVASLARPGGNITGLSWMSPELSAKLLQVIKEITPNMSRIAVLWNAANPVKVRDFSETQRAARRLDLTVNSVEVKTLSDLGTAFAAVTRTRSDALLTLVDEVFNPGTFGRIADFAMKERLPSIIGQEQYAAAGGLIGYGPSLVEVHRRAAVYTHKILKGARPGDLPVEQPTKFVLVINLKTAKALGLAIPPSLLLRADQVIE
jgi:putative ABC transport system substrate-binding protein